MRIKDAKNQELGVVQITTIPLKVEAWVLAIDGKDRKLYCRDFAHPLNKDPSYAHSHTLKSGTIVIPTGNVDEHYVDVRYNIVDKATGVMHRQYTDYYAMYDRDLYKSVPVYVPTEHHKIEVMIPSCGGACCWVDAITIIKL